MGNNVSTSYAYTLVDDIPEGTPPPSLAELSQKIKEVSLYAVQKFDPVELKTCQNCLNRATSSDSTTLRKIFSDPRRVTKNVDSILTDLSTYQPDQPPFSEKTYQFKMARAPDVWISSTKNSDHTISYWFQYPVLPFYIQAAFLSCMNLPITTANLHQIAQRYTAVYAQLVRMNKNEIAKCEQIEPLYVDLAVKALLSRGYTYHKKHIEID